MRANSNVFVSATGANADFVAEIYRHSWSGPLPRRAQARESNVPGTPNTQSTMQ
jgi:hypothetical protein